MANRNENNSTGYQHPQESNLFNLHNAMEYDAVGKPVLRVRVDGGQVTISGDVVVDEVGLTASTLAALETTTVLQGTDPWTVDGTVELGATSLSALENINASVTGTVNIGTLPEVEVKNDVGNPLNIIGTEVNPFGVLLNAGTAHRRQNG